MTQTITIDPVTRIEGHARVVLAIDDDRTVKSAALVVNELRGFERILVGMEAGRMPAVTARICGVCPSAHHLAAAKALDAAAGVEPPPAAKLLRELLYMGHVIHSHALSIFVLQGPDLVFGFGAEAATRNIVGMVEAVPDVARKALRLRTLGQKLNEAIGGRGVHPVTAVAGGMSFRMTPEQRQSLIAPADEALRLAVELSAVAKGLLARLLDQAPGLATSLSFPSYSMGTVNHGALDFCHGDLRVVDVRGEVVAEFPTRDYDKHLAERALEWSYMKPVYVVHDGKERLYQVNALARLNVVDHIGTPRAQAELEAFRATHGRPCHLTTAHVQGRVIELLYAAERARQILDDPALLGESRVPVSFPGGRGVGHVEAPRGTLIHDYEIDEKGIVRSANLIVATQQNYAAINRTIRQIADGYIRSGASDQVMLDAVEFGIRCYDPCLSCATHALGRMPLSIEVRHGDEVVRRIVREA